MRLHAWLLVSIIPFFGSCANIESIFLEPRSLISEPVNRQPSKENNRQLAFTPKPLNLSGSKVTLSDRAAVSEPIHSESESDSTIISSKSESSSRPPDPRMQFTQSHTDNVTHTITRSRINSKFTSNCVCGDGQTFSQRRREEGRVWSEKRHKHEVEKRHKNEIKRRKREIEKRHKHGVQKRHKREVEKRHKHEVFREMEMDLVGNLSKLQGKTKRDEDRIVNGYDVSGLARPWHASLVMTTKK